MLFGLRLMVYISPFISGFFILRGEIVPRTGTLEDSSLLTITLYVMGACVVLFALREHRRLYYGLLELAFAFVLVWSAAVKLGSLNGAVIAATTFGNDSLFALGAAIYVGVRALDNLGQALDKHPAAYRVWLWFFFYSDDEAEAKIEAATQAREKRPKLIEDLAFEGRERPMKKLMRDLDTREQK